LWEQNTGLVLPFSLVEIETTITDCALQKMCLLAAFFLADLIKPLQIGFFVVVNPTPFI
jgi:hypothetical protein